MNEENYSSDSDQSDEDFCPEKIKNCDESLSEEEEEDDSDALSEGEEITRAKKASNSKRKTNKTNKSRKANNDCESEEEQTASATRIQTRTGVSLGQAECSDKDQLESDDDDKGRTDSLWSSFLSDVQPTNTPKIHKTESTSIKSEKTTKQTKTDLVSQSTSKKNIFEEETITEKSSNNIEIANLDEDPQLERRKPTTVRTPIGLKRPATSAGGLGSILGSIEKKKKESVLEKSKLDWNRFKEDAGLDEELQTHNKGKDGYLERMDFLQRTDLRQFEIEKKLRISRRAK